MQEKQENLNNHFVLKSFDLFESTIDPNQKKIFKIRSNPLILFISFTVQNYLLKKRTLKGVEYIFYKSQDVYWCIFNHLYIRMAGKT